MQMTINRIEKSLDIFILLRAETLSYKNSWDALFESQSENSRFIASNQNIAPLCSKKFPFENIMRYPIIPSVHF